jgi:uncharacterized protein (TIGR02145 family)
MKLIYLILFAIFFSPPFLFSQKDVRIGSQVWTSKNLDVSTFRNGDLIPEVTTKDQWIEYGKLGKPAWCYFGNHEPNNKKTGKLYNWFAVNDPRGLAPLGWHIPSISEWDSLFQLLGNLREIGNKLKSKDGWETRKYISNSTGFSAKAGGWRNIAGDFRSGTATFWSSTAELWQSFDSRIDSNNAGCVTIFAYSNEVSKSSFDKRMGLSVRCIKD